MRLTALAAAVAGVLAARDAFAPSPSARRSPAQPASQQRLVSTIAFMSTRGDSSGDPFLAAEIYLMNADGTNQRRLTNNSAADNYPVLSPNGRKIVFASNRGFEPASVSNLYLMNADGSDQTQLTSGSAPSWSPDGLRLAYEDFVRGANVPVNGEIFVINADGTGRTNLTNHPAFDHDAAWSPDGRKIAFTSGRDSDGDREIFAMNTDGTEPTQLSFNTVDDVAPAWSPNGREIAFMSRRDGPTYEIYVMSAGGGAVRRLTVNNVLDGTPSWSPDGKQIVFHSRRAGDLLPQIYVMNADGSAPTRLTSGPGRNQHATWGWGPAQER